jgi:3-oxoacyl-[acyl-carrier protein] reductase
LDLGLDRRVVLVTGSSQGIGAAAATGFAREGARVAVTYRHDRARAEKVAARVLEAGGEPMVVFYDLADHDTIRAATGAVLDRWGRIDVLVNNAVDWGTRRPFEMPPFEDIAADEWRAVLHHNIDGAYAATQAVVPAMRRHGWGRILNVSSGIAVDGLPGAGPYAAAKAGLHGLTRTLAKELGPAGILVNVVMPGATLTEHIVEVVPAAALEQMALASPIRRLLPPEEVVPTMIFLCSAANTAVTGEVIRASGGIT